VVFDRTLYGRRMIDEPHRSQAAAYAGLIEDVRNDGVMLDRFIPVAMRVNDLDIKRNKALGRVSELSPREYDDAQARMRENVPSCNGPSNARSSASPRTDGVGAAGDPRSRSDGGRCRPPDRAALRARVGGLDQRAAGGGPRLARRRLNAYLLHEGTFADAQSCG